jgi:hypothetical protein
VAHAAHALRTDSRHVLLTSERNRGRPTWRVLPASLTVRPIIAAERLDTGVGVAVEVVGAVVLMAACAFGLAHTKALGNFADLSATCALGDVYPKMRHSLHWKPKQAPRFYGLYALLVGLSAVVALAWGNDLGVVIDGGGGTQRHPAAVRPGIPDPAGQRQAVLGPWTNRAQNWIGGLVVWAVTTFSLAPLVTTFYPDVTLNRCLYTLVICTIIGMAAAAILWRFRPSRHQPVSLAPHSNRRPPGMTRSEWREILRDRRTAWRTPGSTRSSGRPSASRARSGC